MREPRADVFAGGVASAPSGVLPSEHSRFSQSFQYFCGFCHFSFFMRTVLKICLIKFIMNFKKMLTTITRPHTGDRAMLELGQSGCRSQHSCAVPGV